MKKKDDLLKGGNDASPEYTEGGQDPDEFFSVGLFLLKRDRVKEAMTAFRQALDMRKTEPRYMSYYGYCLAKVEGRTREGATLCEKAVQKEFFRVELFINLARVYIMAGNRKKAHVELRKGLTLDKENKEILAELDRMGTRKPPVFPFLERKNPINKLAGKFLHRLRLR